jgi:hypothetical protein
MPTRAARIAGVFRWLGEAIAPPPFAIGPIAITMEAMTAQVQDGVTYQDEEHSLVGIKGAGLFDPREAGIRCEMMNTACWRGYVAHYAVEDGELRLASLQMQLFGWGSKREPPQPGKQDVVPVLGVLPTEVTEYGYASFGRIGVRVPFTGGLLVGRDFVRELYVHMGFHPAWKYRVVHELAFEDGRLVKEADRTASMAEIRARLAAQPREPGTRDDGEILRWIEQCFDRSYI